MCVQSLIIILLGICSTKLAHFIGVNHDVFIGLFFALACRVTDSNLCAKFHIYILSGFEIHMSKLNNNSNNNNKRRILKTDFLE